MHCFDSHTFNQILFCFQGWKYKQRRICILLEPLDQKGMRQNEFNTIYFIKNSYLGIICYFYCVLVGIEEIIKQSISANNKFLFNIILANKENSTVNCIVAFILLISDFQSIKYRKII